MEQMKEKSDEDCVKILIGNKVDLAVTFMVDRGQGGQFRISQATSRPLWY